MISECSRKRLCKSKGKVFHQQIDEVAAVTIENLVKGKKGWAEGQ